MLKLLNPTLKRAKLSDKVWMKPEKELSKYFKITAFLFDIQEYSSGVKDLMKRIKALIKRSGIKFAFLYLKECNRLLVRYLAGSGDTDPIKGIQVRRDPDGLPKLIPTELRSAIKNCDFMKKDSAFVQFVLTLINVYRVFNARAKVSLGTITDPFQGLNKTLDNK
jgi:hypothetical protein